MAQIQTEMALESTISQDWCIYTIFLKKSILGQNRGLLRMVQIAKIGTMEFEVVHTGQNSKFRPLNKDAEIHVFTGHKNGVYKIDSNCNPYMTNIEFNYLACNYSRDKGI